MLSKKSFLPEDYVRDARERRSGIFALALFVIVMGAVFSAFLVTNRQWAAVRAAQTSINDETEKAAKEIAEMKRLEAMRAQMTEEANGAPVLVAYHFKHDLERLRRRFTQARVLDADPSTIHKWNAGSIPILLAHPASAGHGLNLADGGNILAFFGVNWNLEEYMQIIERIGPMRQKQAGYDRPCLVYPILARDTVDELVMDRLASKRSVQEVLLDAMNRRKN